MSSPRIALLAHRGSVQAPTGVARYAVEVTTALAAAGSGVRYVFGEPAAGARPGWLPDGVEHADLGGLRKARTVAWSLLGRPRVDRRLGAPDLVHPLYAWAPTPTSSRLVVTVHDLMPIHHPDWYPWRERFANLRALRDAVRRADRVIAISRFVADDLVATLGLDPARVVVVHNGVGDEFFDAADCSPAVVGDTARRHGVEPGRYLVAVGSVSTRKNLPVVLEAIARRPRDGTVLFVAGPPGDGADRIEARVDELGIRDRVRFGGFVDRAALPILVAGAAALVHPSLDEGFGLPPLEAMAAGTPALAARRASLPEVVGDAGELLDPTDPDEWAAAIGRALDPDLGAALRRRGLAHVAGFRWATTAAGVAAVHADVLADAR